MKNYTSKKNKTGDEVPTLSELAESLARIGAQLTVQVAAKPPAPPNTTLLGLYSSIQVAKKGLIVGGDTYDSRELRDLAKSIDGPLFVRVGGSKHLVMVRGKSSWICVPRVQPAGDTLPLH